MEKITVPMSVIYSWNKEGYHTEATGDNVSLIMIGEYHYLRSFQKSQNRLIYTVNPEYVLHENLRDRRYNAVTGDFSILRPHAVRDAYIPSEHVSAVLIELCRLKGYTLIGIDLGQGELRDAMRESVKRDNPREIKVNNSGLIASYRMSPDIPRHGRFSGFTRGLPEAFSLRERKMVETMREYTNKSHKPVIAIVGSDHARTIHEEGSLKDAEFDYCIIDQGSVITPQEAPSFKPIRLLTMRGVHYTVDR